MKTLYILFAVGLIALVSLGGVLTILSINALFSTAIALNFWNWAAATWLTGVFAPVRYTFKK
jgi:hypothetical protein